MDSQPLRAARIHYLDWLKVLVVYGIGIYHSALVFSYTSWLVNNHQRDLVLTAFTGFTFPWGIPLLFFVAGADATFALRHRTAFQFARQRFNRLALPLVAGMLVLSPGKAPPAGSQRRPSPRSPSARERVAGL